MDPNTIHPVDFTQELFEQASHERKEEVVYFWRKFGQPSQMEFFMDRVIAALESNTMRPLRYEGTEKLQEFCREVWLRELEAKAKNQTV